MIAHGAIAREIAVIDSDTDRAEKTDRFQRYRRRRRRGLKVYYVELSEWDMVSALIERGFLTEEQSRDDAAISAVLAKYLNRAAVEKFPLRVAAWDIKP
jgi:hypothetical protein